MGHRFRGYRAEYGVGIVLVPDQPHDDNHDHVLHFSGWSETASCRMPVDGSGGSAAIPVRMDGEPEPDLVVPVLPCHSRVAERVLHRNLSDVAACALLDAIGAVLRYGFAVHSHVGYVYWRRVAGAVRMG